MAPAYFKKSIFILTLLFITFSSIAQKGGVGLRFGIGLESVPSFEVGQTEYSMDGPAAGIGLDYSITNKISVGVHHNFSSNLEGDSYDLSSGFYTPFEYSLNHTIIRGRISTDPWRFFSVYFNTGVHFIKYDYPSLNFDRSATGVSAGAGLVLKIGRFRFNLAELNALTLNNHLFSDTVNEKFYLNLKAGIAIRIIEPL